MCGRFTLALTPEELAEAFGLLDVPEEAVPRYNVAPSQDVLVVMDLEPRAARWARWGLVPGWAKDPSVGVRMINARGETIASKPAFRGAFSKRRCLVLADGFYEWMKVAGEKRPHYIRQRSKRPFSMAGLWEVWRAPEGELLRTCTIVTTEACSMLAAVHDRMPVIVAEADRSTWLSHDPGDSASLHKLIEPFPSEALEAYPVSPRVGSPQHDDVACIAPVGEPFQARGSDPGVGKGQHVLDFGGSGEEHDEPVDTEGRAGSGGH